MFEYVRVEISKRLENAEKFQKMQIKEKEELEEQIKEIDFLIDLKNNMRVMSITYIVGLLFLVAGTYFLGISSIMTNIICVAINTVVTGFVFKEKIYDWIEINKDVPEFKKTSIKDYKKHLEELISKKKEVSRDILESISVVDKYEATINSINLMESAVNTLDDLSYAYKNAKDEDEYIDMGLKEQFFRESMNEFLGEPIDYKNVHFELNEPKKKQEKNLVKTYDKN